MPKVRQVATVKQGFACCQARRRVPQSGTRLPAIPPRSPGCTVARITFLKQAAQPSVSALGGTNKSPRLGSRRHDRRRAVGALCSCRLAAHNASLCRCSCASR